MNGAAGVITDEIRAWIGRSTPPIAMTEGVSESDLRRYIETTGDRNPLWLDDKAAQAAGLRARVLPPMMVVALRWRLQDAEASAGAFPIPLPHGYTDRRNAEAEVEWFDQLYLGERIVIQERITDITAREGRRGIGIYITRLIEYRVAEDQRPILQIRQTAVTFQAAAQ